MYSFLHARAIDPIAESHMQASYHLLWKAQEKMNLVLSKLKDVEPKNLPLLSQCQYHYARVKALLNDVNGCFHALIKAKLNGELSTDIELVRNNPDFKVISGNNELMEILSEPVSATKERLAFEEDAMKYRSKQAVFDDPATLERSMTESQIVRNALTTSTLDFLVGKFPLAINLRDFFQPVVNTLHYEAHNRLKERMQLYGVQARREIPGDGNCQMHSLSDQLCGNLNHAKHIRGRLVSWLRAHASLELPNGCTLKDFVHDQTWDQYCAKMSKEGEWGDHLTLIAAAEVFSGKIIIISSIPGDNYLIEVVPALTAPQNLMMLSHFAEFHYGSVHPCS